VALDSNAVEKAFAARGIVPLKGDWTSGDPEITDFLERFGRNGVPLYVYYDGSRPPVVLPQILTAAIVLDTIGKS
jgi:thiol:disulfide interchange protein